MCVCDFQCNTHFIEVNTKSEWLNDLLQITRVACGISGIQMKGLKVTPTVSLSHPIWPFS